jgi:glycosyltransferase involved in cell wall biosynthesis
MDKLNSDFVSVIIPVLNDSERLEICLNSLEKQTYPKELYEVIIVDNGSDENIEDLVKKFPQAALAYQPQRGSYAARNQGISIAKGEILAFTDSDCIPAQDWLETGVKHLLSMPNGGLVAGRIEIFFKHPDHPTSVEYYDMITNLQQKYYAEIEKYAATANLFTFKKVFEEIGYFNAKLKSGGDSEWGKRAVSSGYAIAYAEDTCVAHPARCELDQLYKKTIRQAGGHYDRDKDKDTGYTLSRLIQDISSLRPPLRSALLKTISANQLKNPTQKIELFSIIFYIHYLRFFEKMRLRLGGKSKG